MRETEPIDSHDTDSDLESDTPSDRATTEPIAPVQVEMDLPSAKSKPEGEPKWVTDETRSHYKKLVNDSALLAKVKEAIDTHPNTSALAQALIPLGFHKRGKTPQGKHIALTNDKMSHIRKVVTFLTVKTRNNLSGT